MSLPLCRPYQTECLDRALEHVQAGATSILIVQPTGCGKTRTAIEAALGHVRLGGTVLFVAPRRELVAQATKTAIAAGLRPEVNFYARTIHELLVDGAAIPAASLVVLDEARHYLAEEWRTIRTHLPDALVIGLDATPERADGLGLRGMFEVIIEAISVKDAIGQGFLVPCEVLRPSRPLPAGELAQDPLDMYVREADGSSAVVFLRSVLDAQELAARFCARGTTAAAVWGNMPRAERDAALEAYACGAVRVLTNMNLLTEGWDAPITSTVITARTFQTAGGMLQAVGRGLRLYPGKKRCLFIDLTGSSHVHGEVDDVRTWHLDGRACRREGGEIEIRFCPLCGQPVPGPKCEECGYEGDQMKRRKPRVLGLPCERFARQRQESDAQKAHKLSFYLGEARRSGRKTWWAFKRFEGVYGHLPTPIIKTLAKR